MVVLANRDKKGFTLIEVLVSIAILAICLDAIMNMFSAISMANVKNEIRTKMTNVLVNYVENVTSGNFSGINSETKTGSVKIRSFTLPYTIISSVTDTSLPGGIEKKNIVASIKWSYKGRSYSYSIATVVVNE